MIVDFLLGNDSVKVMVNPRIESVEFFPSIDILPTHNVNDFYGRADEIIHIKYSVEYVIGNSIWQVPYNVKLTRSLTNEGYDFCKKMIESSSRQHIFNTLNKLSDIESEKYFLVKRKRHIAIPYCDIEMRENFKYLIHFLFTLDFNKNAKINNSAFRLVSEWSFISTDDIDLLSTERKYCICQYKNVTSRKSYFLSQTEEWGIPYLNLDRENVFAFEGQNINPNYGKIFNEEIATGVEKEFGDFPFSHSIYGRDAYNIVPLKGNANSSFSKFKTSYSQSFEQIDYAGNRKSMDFIDILSGTYADCVSVFSDKKALNKLIHNLYKREAEAQKRNNAYEADRYMRTGWKADYFDTMGGTMGDYNGDGDDIENWAKG